MCSINLHVGFLIATSHHVNGNDLWFTGPFLHAWMFSDLKRPFSIDPRWEWHCFAIGLHHGLSFDWLCCRLSCHLGNPGACRRLLQWQPTYLALSLCRTSPLRHHLSLESFGTGHDWLHCWYWLPQSLFLQSYSRSFRLHLHLISWDAQ